MLLSLKRNVADLKRGNKVESQSIFCGTFKSTLIVVFGKTAYVRSHRGDESNMELKIYVMIVTEATITLKKCSRI